MDAHDRAVAEQARRRRESTLVCTVCHKANHPGQSPIELDDDGVAWCPCGYWWQPALTDLAAGCCYGKNKGTQ